MNKKILFMLVIVLTISSAIMVGCGSNDKSEEDSSWKDIKEKGELVIGLDDTFAPMGFRDEDGKLVGFDIDLGEAVTKEMGVKAVFKPINWKAKEMELKSKNVDCLWNGMSVTPAREKAMSLSNKYINNKLVVMTLDKNVKVEKAADLANYKVGTQAGSSALEVIQKNEDYEKFKENVNEYDTYDQAILDMKAGRIDCMVVDQVLGNYKNSKMDNAMYTTEFNFGDDFYAIGFRKEDKTLTEEVNKALKATIDNGEAKKISEKWFGQDIIIFEPIK